MLMILILVFQMNPKIINKTFKNFYSLKILLKLNKFLIK